MAVVELAMLAALALIVSTVFSFAVVAWWYSVFFDPEEEETWLD